MTRSFFPINIRWLHLTIESIFVAQTEFSYFTNIVSVIVIFYLALLSTYFAVFGGLQYITCIFIF